MPEGVDPAVEATDETTKSGSDSDVDDVLRTAAEHTTTAVPIAAPGDSVDTVLASLRGRQFDSAAVVAVLDDDRRVAGLATLERLLAAPAGMLLRDLMDPDPPTVGPGLHQEKAAWAAVQHDEPGLAVVDADGRFVGLIPPQRLLAVLLEEHDEDLARIGGYVADTAATRATSEEPVSRRLWHRLPWLLLGLVGALAAAGVVGAFERQLEQQILVAFFVPGIVYMADAVGTQTEALVIRGLSVGVGIRGIAVREALTGLVVGLLLAVVLLPLTLLIWGEFDVSISVSVALFAACSVATLIAMALPWAFDRVGVDPAYGSGPLATVVQDLLSIVIYFVTAQAVIG